ncbi:MAG: hypothetical protein WBK77_05495 [Alphaproteobacteria bacterium]
MSSKIHHPLYTNHKPLFDQVAQATDLSIKQIINFVTENRGLNPAKAREVTDAFGGKNTIIDLTREMA